MLIDHQYGAIVDRLEKMDAGELIGVEAHLFNEVTKAQNALAQVRARMAAHPDVLRKAGNDADIPAVLVDRAEVDRIVREARDRAEFEQRLAKRSQPVNEDAFRQSRLRPIWPPFVRGVVR